MYARINLKNNLVVPSPKSGMARDTQLIKVAVDRMCINKSMIAQAEYRAKARFQALSRRRRLWSAAQ